MKFLAEGFNGIIKNFLNIHNYNKNLKAVYPSLYAKIFYNNFCKNCNVGNNTINRAINYLKDFICLEKKENIVQKLQQVDLERKIFSKTKIIIDDFLI